jgi:hypothetical protein
MHTYVHACIHQYIHTCTHTYIHAYINAYMHAHIRAYMHTSIPTYVCMHVHAHTHLHQHIHTQKYSYVCIIKVMLKRGEDWVLTLEPGGDTVREGLPWNQAKFLSKMDVLFVKILIQRDL